MFDTADSRGSGSWRRIVPRRSRRARTGFRYAQLSVAAISLAVDRRCRPHRAPEAVGWFNPCANRTADIADTAGAKGWPDPALSLNEAQEGRDSATRLWLPSSLTRALLGEGARSSTASAA